MSINIIAAISKNRVIGLNGTIPWKIPGELKYFKDMTTGKLDKSLKGKHAVIMGWNTFESLPSFPNALPNRGNFIVTRRSYSHLGPLIPFAKIPALKDLIKIQETYPNIWISGGESIYNYYIDKPYIDKLYLTEINKEIKGDTYFPKLPSYFVKTIQGQTYTYKENALSYTDYNYNVYSNSDWTRTGF